MRTDFSTPSAKMAWLTYFLLAAVLVQSVPDATRAKNHGANEAGVFQAESASESSPKVPAPPTNSSAKVEPSPSREIQDAFRVESPLEFPLDPVIVGTAGAKWIELDNDRAALERAIRELQLQGDPRTCEPLLRFLEEHPDSSWRGTVLANIGSRYQSAGSISRAIDSYAKAWECLKQAGQPGIAITADRVFVSLVDTLARVGSVEEVERYLDETELRTFSQDAVIRLGEVRESAVRMRARPDLVFTCGLVAADQLRRELGGQPTESAVWSSYVPASNGLSLAQLNDYERRMGLRLRIAKRSPGAKMIVPSLAHWKVGHFTVLVAGRESTAHVTNVDPTSGTESAIATTTIDVEASGYFLVPDSPLPNGWRGVTAAEATAVVGRGNITDFDPEANGDNDQQHGPCGSGRGMPTYSVSSMLTRLRITDTPLGYVPPVGPPVSVQVIYGAEPYTSDVYFDTPTSGLGLRWRHNWNSWVAIRDGDGTTQNDSTHAYVYPRGGGRERHPRNGTLTGQVPHYRSQALLTRSGEVFTRTLPDGSREIYTVRYTTGGAGGDWKIALLDQVIDAAGNAVTITYGTFTGSNRGEIASISDASGRITTFEYAVKNLTARRLIRVTDPFGRSAEFDFELDLPNRWTQLNRITDAEGIVSTLAYGGSVPPYNPELTVASMTTPYGTTSFSGGTYAPENSRWIEVTDPMGAKERFEYTNTADGLFASDDTDTLPQGMESQIANNHLNGSSSFYWNKRQYAAAIANPPPGTSIDYSMAEQTSWMRSGYNHSQAVGVVRAVKRPLERRMWFVYQGQPATDEINVSGAYPAKPWRVGQRISPTETVISETLYNAIGNPTQFKDPVGRVTSLVYAANNNDVIEVRQNLASGYATLAGFTYNTGHQPLTHTDAAGQTTTYTYFANGQPHTVTNANGELTTYAYNTSGAFKGYASTVTGPTGVVMMTYGYDFTSVPGRRKFTETNQDGYAVTREFDKLDRFRKATYPDGTFEEVTFDPAHPLDMGTHRDRRGRVTSYTHDALRRMTSVTDPAQRTTLFGYCGCGSLDSMTDAENHTTEWDYDLLGRLITKTLHDQTTTRYVYDPYTDRLAAMLDSRLGADGLNPQRTEYAYNLDDTVKNITYLNEVVSDPSEAIADVAVQYDPYFRRMTQITDGTGVTTYSYHASGVLGGLRVATVNGPLVNDTIGYTYDKLGRSASRTVHTTPESWDFDSLGRLNVNTNPLGEFKFTYDGASNRLTVANYPNGQSTHFSYHGSTGDWRMSSMTYRSPSQAVLKSFDYSQYTPDGRLDRIAEDGTGTVAYDYNDADELTSASPSAPPTAWAGSDTPGIFAPTSSSWLLRSQNSSGPADTTFGYGPAPSTWTPLVGDWDGDGDSTPGLYNPASGAFFLRNANSSGAADVPLFTFGPSNSTWKPVAGDWNGDGVDTIGLYDPATGSYFLRNANAAGPADVTLSFGAGGASILPIVGDWDGDGDDTVGIYASGSGNFFLRNSNTPGGADIVVSFGAAGSTPVVGDWDGNGSDTIGIYAPASGAWFMRNANTPGGADYAFTYGAPNSIPLVGDWDNTSVGVPPWMRTYSYDDAGNRLSTTRSETGYSVNTTYNSTNQIVSQTGSEPLSATYDANGNLRTIGTRSYYWDAQDRLTGFNDSSNGRRSEFKYDGYGRRTRIIDKSNSVVVNDRTYIWSRTQIVEERDTATNVTLRRFYGGGFTEGASNTKYFYVGDHLGSVRALTDSAGNMVTRIDYDSFGRRTMLTGSVPPTFGYAGYFTHGWSLLNLTLLRVRDPESGRWLSRDPIGEAAGFNLYTYVLNRPVSYIDPLGDDSLSVTGGASVGGGVGFVGAGATGSVKVGYDWTRDEWGGSGTGGGYAGGPYGDYDPTADPKWYQGFGFGGWAGFGTGLTWSDADGFMSEAGVTNGTRFYAGFVSAEIAEDASGNESWTVLVGPGLPSFGFEWFTTTTGGCFVDKGYEWDKEHNPRHHKNPFWW